MHVAPVNYALLCGTTPKQSLLGILTTYVWPDGCTVHLSRELQSSVAASRQAQDAAGQALAQVKAQLAGLQEQQSADKVGPAIPLPMSQIKGSNWQFTSCWPCPPNTAPGALQTLIQPHCSLPDEGACLVHTAVPNEWHACLCTSLCSSHTAKQQKGLTLLLLQATLQQQLDAAASAAEQAQTQLAQTADRLAAHEEDAGLVAGALADGLPSLLPKPRAGEEHALGQLQARLRQECPAPLVVSLLRAAATAGQQQQAQLRAVEARLTKLTQQLSEAAQRLQGMTACLAEHGKSGHQAAAAAEDFSAALDALESAVQQADARLQEQVDVLAGVQHDSKCSSWCSA